MSRPAVFTIATLLIGLVAFTILRSPGDDIMSVDEREAAANNPDVITEKQTAEDETIVSGTVLDSSAEDLIQSYPEDAAQTPDRPEALTLDGYDRQRVRELLQDSDIAAPRRAAYLDRLEQVEGDRSALAAVLRELRAEL